MARTPAVPTVEVAWEPALTGVFTVGTSTIGGADVLAGGFGAGTFTDVTGDTKEATIRRGLTGDMGAVQAGTCRLVLADPDGTYNPENPASPLAGLLLPLRPVRVRATHLGTQHGLFHGFVTRIEHDPDPSVRETVIDCADLFEWLAHAAPVVAPQGLGVAVGTALGLLLDGITFTDPADRALDGGGALRDFYADGQRTALDAVQSLLAVDLGLAFVDGDGVFTYHDRARLYGAREVDATLTGALVGSARPGVDVAGVVTRQRVTRTGGAEQAHTDAAAAALYGFRDGPPITTDLLQSDTEASSLAQFLVLLKKDPRRPTRAVGLLNRDDEAIAHQLTRELGDLVDFSEERGGTSTVGVVVALRHRIADGGLVHETHLTLRERTAFAGGGALFVVGTSTIGGADVLGF